MSGAREGRPEKVGGVGIRCGRCEKLLATSYGARLDCYGFDVEHRVKLKCAWCGHETRWAPEKIKRPVDAPDSPD